LMVVRGVSSVWARSTRIARPTRVPIYMMGVD
jgi:hypothetical protein